MGGEAPPQAGSRPKRILVAAIGEAHQLLHVLGTARELHRLGVNTHCLISTDWHQQVIAAHAPELAAKTIRTRLMYQGRPIYECPPRAPNLFLGRNEIAQFDAVLTPERTSTLLRAFLGKRCPKLIHIPHGAGDRAKGYDKRIRSFELVLVAGPKDRDAYIARQLATPDNCHVVGYGKFDVLSGEAPRFFENDKPVVLYNPHFEETLSSWLPFGEALIRGFRQSDDFNFIIAPHIRLRGRSRALFDTLARTCAGPNLQFDGGSVHSINMDYTRAADIYLGDVSSQVYEFLRTPGPCVFADAHDTDWQEDPHFRHWNYGKVANRPAGVMDCLGSAAGDHAAFRRAQTDGFSAAIEASTPTASERAAKRVLAFLG